MAKLKEFYVVMESPDKKFERRISLSAVDEEHAKEIANDQARAIQEQTALQEMPDADEARRYDFVQKGVYKLKSIDEV